MRPDDVLSAIRDDSRQIFELSAWCHNDGFWPKGPAPDRVAGVHQQDVFGRDQEDVPDAYRFDIGVGDNRSREAFESTAWLVTFIDLRLAAAFQALGVVSPLFGSTAPRFALVRPDSPLSVRGEALRLSLLRIEAIAECWDNSYGRSPKEHRVRQKEARVELADPRISPPSARNAADLAVRRLSKALARGATDGLATAEKYCTNCKMQPVGERTGDRCPACSQYKWRSGGIERPASRYLADNAEAFAAAARRRARGDGFGAA